MGIAEDIARAIAILEGGRLYGDYVEGTRLQGAGSKFMRGPKYSRARGVATAAARAATRQTAAARALGGSNPYGWAALLAVEGYIHRDDIRDVVSLLEEGLRESGSSAALTPKGRLVKRKLSKANKAMKQAMKATKNNFKQATKIASKANPATKSKIGKGTTKVKKLARKIRKSVWGVTKRFRK